MSARLAPGYRGYACCPELWATWAAAPPSRMMAGSPVVTAASDGADRKRCGEAVARETAEKEAGAGAAEAVDEVDGPSVRVSGRRSRGEGLTTVEPPVRVPPVRRCCGGAVPERQQQW